MRSLGTYNIEHSFFFSVNILPQETGRRRGHRVSSEVPPISAREKEALHLLHLRQECRQNLDAEHLASHALITLFPAQWCVFFMHSMGLRSDRHIHWSNIDPRSTVFQFPKEPQCSQTPHKHFAERCVYKSANRGKIDSACLNLRRCQSLMLYHNTFVMDKQATLRKRSSWETVVIFALSLLIFFPQRPHGFMIPTTMIFSNCF